MPGSRDSDEEAHINEEPGAHGNGEYEVSPAFTDATIPVEQQTTEGASAAGDEGYPEEKPQAPILGLDLRDPLAGELRVKSESPAPNQATRAVVSAVTLKKKPAKATKAKSSTGKKKLKAPSSDAEVTTEKKASAVDKMLEYAYARQALFEFIRRDPVLRLYTTRLLNDLTGPVAPLPPPVNMLAAGQTLTRLLADAGFAIESVEANEFLELDLDDVRTAAGKLFNLLSPLVGTKAAGKHPASRATNPEVQGAYPDAPGYQTGSSHYLTPSSEPDSDASSGIRRMTLGPGGAAMLRARQTLRADAEEYTPVRDANSRGAATTNSASIARKVKAVSTTTQTAFDAMMEEYLRRQQTTARAIVTPPAEDDVEMESVDSAVHRWEYDPDDLDWTPARAVAAATAITPQAIMPRVRMSATSDLKEFSGKDTDDDRARSWLSKVKTAFSRDQATDEEKCLIFGDLLVRPARDWYRQLSRSTRNSWPDMVEQFQVQYCGQGVSAARQYYHARKRSDESPLDYLYRLNVAGLRARLKIKDGPAATRREHVEHFIETLDDQDLADQLTMLRLPDAESLEDVLRSRQRAKNRQRKATHGFNKFRQKPTPTPTPAANNRAVHVIHAGRKDSESEGEASSSEGEGDLRHVYLATANERPTVDGEKQVPPDCGDQDRQTREHRIDLSGKRCSHCGSLKHNDLGCWKRLTCQKCGKQGHPSDRCLFVCRGCGELHDIGKCPMEEFYNLVRQWYNPSKHAGMLPADAEKMLN